MSAPSLLNLPPSRLTLGSAQFGFSYGVANRSGMPDYETVREIIREAHLGGVNVIDTAAAYGGSEEVVGRALNELGLRDSMRVVTKVQPLPSGVSDAEAARLIEESVTRSLRNLGLEQVHGCLFHREEEMRFAGHLCALQERGLVDLPGLSMNHPDFARAALGRPGLRIWQFPANALDRRFTHSGLAAAARKQGVVVFGRSAYLQGLLLLDDESTPRHLSAVIEPRRRLRALGEQFGISAGELFMRLMLSRPEIDSVIVGMETVAQVRENLRLFAQGSLPPNVLAAFEAFEPAVPEIIITPPRWEAAKAKSETTIREASKQTAERETSS